MSSLLGVCQARKLTSAPNCLVIQDRKLIKDIGKKTEFRQNDPACLFYILSLCNFFFPATTEMAAAFLPLLSIFFSNTYYIFERSRILSLEKQADVCTNHGKPLFSVVMEEDNEFYLQSSKGTVISKLNFWLPLKRFWVLSVILREISTDLGHKFS